MSIVPESYPDYIKRLFYSHGEESLIFTIEGNQVYDITMQVTENCNLACSYCYQTHKTSQAMSFDIAKKFIDLILASDERTSGYIQSRKSAGCVLNFIGGEPFLEIDLLEKISDYFILQLIELDHPWLNRFRFSISTNGTLYNEPKVQSYLQKHKNHLSLTVTVDGNEELHNQCRLFPNGAGSYAIAHAAALDWKKRTSELASKLTFSPDNINFSFEAIKTMIEDGYVIIHANCAYEKGWENAHAKIFYKQLILLADYLIDQSLEDSIFISILDEFYADEQKGQLKDSRTFCGGNGLMLACDPRGKIYPCLRYCQSSLGKTLSEEVCLGNVNEGLLINEKQKNLIKEFSCITRQSQFSYTPKCLKCQISDGCGDCAAYSYQDSGIIGYRTTYICEMHIAQYLAHYYYYNKAFQIHNKKKPIEMRASQEQMALILSPSEMTNLLGIERSNNIYDD